MLNSSSVWLPTEHSVMRQVEEDCQMTGFRPGFLQAPCMTGQPAGVSRPQGTVTEWHVSCTVTVELSPSRASTQWQQHHHLLNTCVNVCWGSAASPITPWQPVLLGSTA